MSSAEERAAWLREARFGVMTHYLADWIARRENERPSVEQWNELVDNFEVEAAGRAARIGRRALLSHHDRPELGLLSCRRTPRTIASSAASRAAARGATWWPICTSALRKRNIRFMVYLPAGRRTAIASAKKLQWQNGPHPNREFQAKWEQVIREWSTRWGERVAGWWFDGCYWPNTMYRGDESPNFESFAAAARAGNPNSIVAFNPGVFLACYSMSPHEDYTAGEINNVAGIEIRRQENGRLDGAQIHILSYLGERWGRRRAALCRQRRRRAGAATSGATTARSPGTCRSNRTAPSPSRSWRS